MFSFIKGKGLSTATAMSQLLSGNINPLINVPPQETGSFHGMVIQGEDESWDASFYHDLCLKRIIFCQEEVGRAKRYPSEQFDRSYSVVIERLGLIFSDMAKYTNALHHYPDDKKNVSWQNCLAAFEKLVIQANRVLSKLKLLELVKREGINEVLAINFDSLSRKVDDFILISPNDSWFGGEHTLYFAWLNKVQNLMLELSKIEQADKKEQLKERITNLKQKVEEKKEQVCKIVSQKSLPSSENELSQDEQKQLMQRSYEEKVQHDAEQLRLQQEENERQRNESINKLKKELLKSIDDAYLRMFGGIETSLGQCIAPFDPVFFKNESEGLLRTFSAELDCLKDGRNSQQIQNILNQAFIQRNGHVEELNYMQKLLLSFGKVVTSKTEEQESVRTDFLKTLSGIILSSEFTEQFKDETHLYANLLHEYNIALDKICGDFSPLEYLQTGHHRVDAFFKQRIAFKNEMKHAQDYLTQWVLQWAEIEKLRESGKITEAKKKGRQLLAWCAPDHHLTQGPFCEKISYDFYDKYHDKILDFAAHGFQNESEAIATFMQRFEQIKIKIQSMSASLIEVDGASTNASSHALTLFFTRDEITQLRMDFKKDLDKRLQEDKISPQLAFVQEAIFFTNCDFLVGMYESYETERNLFYDNTQNRRLLEQLQSDIKEKEERDKIEDEKIAQMKARAKAQDEELEKLRAVHQQEQNTFMRLTAQIESMMAASEKVHQKALGLP